MTGNAGATGRRATKNPGLYEHRGSVLPGGERLVLYQKVLILNRRHASEQHRCACDKDRSHDRLPRLL